MNYDEMTKGELIKVLRDDDAERAKLRAMLEPAPTPTPIWRGWRIELSETFAGCKPTLSMLALVFIALVLVRSLWTMRRFPPRGAYL